jgi:hypothetical protein
VQAFSFGTLGNGQLRKLRTYWTNPGTLEDSSWEITHA